MSLPEDLLDQLLTGYVDDALSADERARVERLLQSNREIADELAQLLQLRASLRAIAEADSVIQLEAGFADRVLDAAVARAHSEGLTDDHPLVRLAEQPSTKTAATTSQSSSWRFAGVLVALAASIAIAVIALRPEPRQPDGFAGGPGIPPVVPVPNHPGTNIPEPDEFPVPEVVEGPGASTPEMLAVSEPENVPTESPESAVVAPEPEPRATPPSEAVVKARTMETIENVPSLNLNDLQSPMGAILVLDVRRTESGRQLGAVQEAMKEADIAPPSKLQITDQVAGFVREQSEAASDDVSVFYLLVQGKSFEKLYNSLWNDQQGIESVRMTLSLDAPLMKAASAVRPDPTTIRGNGTALELFSDNGVVNQFAHELGQLDFPPMGNRNKSPVSPVSVGNDIQAQVLILVR